MENFKVVANWHERPLMNAELQAEVDAHEQQLTTAKTNYDAGLDASMGDLQEEITAGPATICWPPGNSHVSPS